MNTNKNFLIFFLKKIDCRNTLKYPFEKKRTPIKKNVNWGERRLFDQRGAAGQSSVIGTIAPISSIPAGCN